MGVLCLTSDNFTETVSTSKIPVIVDFYANWCQPCKRLAPILEEIAAENEGRILVCKINIDENRDLATKYSVMSIPYVVCFKNGEPYKKVIGLVAKNELLSLAE